MLHTARSRNDQVATDVALYVRDAAAAARLALAALIEVVIARAESHVDWPMPGYTHLQRAQPVYLGHHLLAYAWMFLRDRARFAVVIDACGALPLGAGALAGVNYATDRERVAGELGFPGVSPNSIDAVSNRDFALDYLAAAATAATHLSRLGAELVLWSSEEFGFCELADAWTSGSSIMPQKKNPDAAELLRAKAPRVVAHLAALHGVMHGLPLTYNKDMQEDKEHLFDTADTLALSLAAARGMLESAAFNRERMAAAAADEMIAAVDVADLLVGTGVPFREAHGAVAGLVRDRRRTGAHALRAERAGAGRARARARPAARFASCCAARAGSSRRSRRAGRRSCASASSSTRCARRSRRGERPPLRPRRRGGRAGADRPRRARRGCLRADRRDRGLPRDRAGVPRVGGAHTAHAHAVRSAGARVRLSLLRGAHDAERGQRARGRRRGGADPCARAARGHRADARAARAPTPRGALFGARASSRRRSGSCSATTAGTCAPGGSRSRHGGGTLPIAASRRIGITRAVELPWRFSVPGSRYVSRRLRLRDRSRCRERRRRRPCSCSAAWRSAWGSSSWASSRCFLRRR